MPDLPNPLAEKQAKLLTVSLELFRQTLSQSVAFMFANRDRKKDAAPEWARAAIEPDTTSKIESGFGLSESRPPQTIASPIRGGFGLNEPKPRDLGSQGAGFGLNEPKASTVSAFDKPQAVIIVGPNPLPVKFDKAMETPATTPRSERAQETGTGNLAKAIAARFLAVIGPLYAMSTILNQTNSGFGVFQKAIGVLGATLAPILLPVFAMLAAGVMTVADIIWRELLPALKDWYEWFLNNKKAVGEVAGGIGGIAAGGGLAAIAGKFGGGGATFGGGIGGAAKGFGARLGLPFAIGASLFEGATGDYYAGQRGRGQSKAGAALASMGGGLMDVISQPLKAIGLINKSFGEAYSEKYKTEINAFRGKNPDGTPQKNADGTPKATTPSFGEDFDKNMKLVIESLGKSMGPKGSYSGLSEVGKQAQLAAINADPVEMVAAQRIIESIQKFMEVVRGGMNKEQGKEQVNRR